MEYLNLDLDKNLTLDSNTTISSQKALKSYIDAKRINLDFLQASAPSEFSIGDKWLNTTDKKVYTATSSSTWDSGVSLTDGQIYSFENLLYHYDGTNILIYSTETITEQNNKTEIKTWFGTQNEYDALSEIDDNTTYYIVDNASTISTLLATQQEFNSSAQNKAATPYQVNQALGNYLPLAGGNLDANAILRLTNSNNGTVTLAYNTSNYLTVSSNLSVSGTTSTNSLIATTGNIYNGSTSGPTVIWSNTFATSSTAGIVKPDGTTTSVDANGVISVIGGGSGGGSVILLQFLQSTTPATYSANDKWLNTSDYKLYTATSSSAWNSGESITEDQIFGFNNLLYHYNGTNLLVYSTESIVEQNNKTEIKTWVGTQDEYNALQSYDVNTIYNITDSNSSYSNQYHPPLLSFMWSDHILNDVKWLRADTFGWQDGTIYNAVYTHLLNDITPVNTDLVYNPTDDSIVDQRSSYRISRIAYRNSTYDYTNNGTTYYAWAYGDALNTFGILVDGWFTLSSTPQANDTVYIADIDNITDGVQATAYTLGVSNQIYCDNIENVYFPVYYKADDGHKICIDDSYVSSVYTYLMPDNPIAWYFVLDTANQRFKLPYVTGHNRILIKEILGNNNRWARIYNDGWVEQGGIVSTSSAAVTVNLEITFADTNYFTSVSQSTTSTTGDSFLVGVRAKAVDSFEIRRSESQNILVAWEAKGYSDIAYNLIQGIETQYKSEEKYLYFYVGNFADTAIEQTAGLNAELFNGKADTDLANVLATIDYVIESQLPTSANNYTWYRKYRSGWIEQGGRVDGTSQNQEITVNLVQTMADANYSISAIQERTTISNDSYPRLKPSSATTTDFKIYVDSDSTTLWEVKGQGA